MCKVTEFNEILNSFNIGATCVNYGEIDTYSYYDLVLSPKTKIRTIEKYSDEISLILKAHKPMFKINYEEGTLRVGFLRSRKTSSNVFNQLRSQKPNNRNISCYVGESLYGNKIHLNFESYPHLLIAGTTGSGKTILLHSIIANLARNKSARIFLVDPKRIEFNDYRPYATAYATTYSECMNILNKMNNLMENTFKALNSGIRKENIVPTFLIIDEFADLILQDQDGKLFNSLCKLAQKCRAANIHIVLATQRPSADIIRGAIKANFPHRISCKVSSQVDSKVILDENGAQNLLGKGDSIIKDSSYNMERFQAGFISKQEVVNLFETA